MNIIIRKAILLLFLFLFFVSPITYGQGSTLNKEDKELTALYAKIFPFYYSNQDSLMYYSDSFATRITSFIKNNPATLNYQFKSLTDSNACGITTSKDGKFRIYSWDTWEGGTMHMYKNLYQFKSNNKVYTKVFDYGEGDIGTYYTNIFSLNANNNTYYLTISGGSESTKDAYETISVYAIENDTLNDKVKLIKTNSGLNNSITFEYDFFSVVNRKERPIVLTKYNEDKKIIYIPIVLEGGKVTDRFILYEFTGQYFEKILTQKKTAK